jgi:hypothetical protein
LPETYFPTEEDNPPISELSGIGDFITDNNMTREVRLYLMDRKVDTKLLPVVLIFNDQAGPVLDQCQNGKQAVTQKTG